MEDESIENIKFQNNETDLNENCKIQEAELMKISIIKELDKLKNEIENEVKDQFEKKIAKLEAKRAVFFKIIEEGQKEFKESFISQSIAEFQERKKEFLNEFKLKQNKKEKEIEKIKFNIEKSIKKELKIQYDIDLSKKVKLLKLNSKQNLQADLIIAKKDLESKFESNLEFNMNEMKIKLENLLLEKESIIQRLNCIQYEKSLIGKYKQTIPDEDLTQNNINKGAQPDNFQNSIYLGFDTNCLKINSKITSPNMLSPYSKKCVSRYNFNMPLSETKNQNQESISDINPIFEILPPPLFDKNILIPNHNSPLLITESDINVSIPREYKANVDQYYVYNNPNNSYNLETIPTPILNTLRRITSQTEEKTYPIHLDEYFQNFDKDSEIDANMKNLYKLQKLQNEENQECNMEYKAELFALKANINTNESLSECEYCCIVLIEKIESLWEEFDLSFTLRLEFLNQIQKFVSNPAEFESRCANYVNYLSSKYISYRQIIPLLKKRNQLRQTIVKQDFDYSKNFSILNNIQEIWMEINSKLSKLKNDTDSIYWKDIKLSDLEAYDEWEMVYLRRNFRKMAFELQTNNSF